MAGTDRRQDSAEAPGPVVILVAPQLGENIGTAARAMLNCGLTEMRLVAPRDSWPNEKAVSAASGADVVLDGARVFPDVAAAIQDLNFVYATTARDRYMVQRQITPRLAAQEMRARTLAGGRVGIMFGPERTGLINDDLSLADTLICVPLNPAFASLNLAQAVLLVGYEWLQAGEQGPAERLETGRSLPASKDELLAFFTHLEKELDACGFLRVPDKRPGMVRNIRNMFQRAQLTDQEVRTLHGIVTELTTLRSPKTRRSKGGGAD